jgi:hypothetical protein
MPYVIATCFITNSDETPDLQHDGSMCMQETEFELKRSWKGTKHSGNCQHSRMVALPRASQTQWESRQHQDAHSHSCLGAPAELMLQNVSPSAMLHYS